MRLVGVVAEVDKRRPLALIAEDVATQSVAAFPVEVPGPAQTSLVIRRHVVPALREGLGSRAIHVAQVV